MILFKVNMQKKTVRKQGCREDFTKLTQLTVKPARLYDKLLSVKYINDGLCDYIFIISITHWLLV